MRSWILVFGFSLLYLPAVLAEPPERAAYDLVSNQEALEKLGQVTEIAVDPVFGRHKKYQAVPLQTVIGEWLGPKPKLKVEDWKILVEGYAYLGDKKIRKIVNCLKVLRDERKESSDGR